MTNDILWIIGGVIILGIVIFLVPKNWRRAVQVMSGWGIYETYNFLVDFILWPLLQAFYGFAGILILIVMALINNFTFSIFYSIFRR
jgi:hypothetical protein